MGSSASGMIKKLIGKRKTTLFKTKHVDFGKGLICRVSSIFLSRIEF